MNNKGFTLIELIATIALLSIIAIISFVSISGILKSKISDCNNLLISIKSATKEYISDNRYDSLFDSDGDKKVDITGRTLVEGNYLSTSITNPFDDNIDITDNVMIEITLNNDYSANMVIIKNNSGNVVSCDNEEW